MNDQAEESVGREKETIVVVRKSESNIESIIRRSQNDGYNMKLNLLHKL